VEIVITTPDLGEFFVEVGRPTPVVGAVHPPTTPTFDALPPPRRSTTTGSRRQRRMPP
jgi:hypothetical protein